MRAVLDVRMYGLEHAGIGRYIANLVREIKNLKLKIKNLEITLLVRRKNLKEIKKKIGDSFKIVLCEASHYSLKEQIVVPLQLIKLKPDLVHFPHFNVPVLWWGKQVVTIHDLTKHESKGPETTTRWPPFYWLKYLAYKFIVWLATKRAARIIVPTKWWKKELARRYSLAPQKVVVIYEGVSEAFRIKKMQHRVRRNLLKAQKILGKWNIKKPFIIYTGSLYPHKNVERLVEVVGHLNDIYHLSLSLVIVCARNVFYERFKKKIRQIEAERFVNLIGFVPDEELVSLYQEAEAFVFPSLLEGFGLPGLEAMAAGCPVLASDTPVLREVYGDAALYFDPLNIKDMAEKIKHVIEDKVLRRRLKKISLERVERYSWKKMAKETLKVYEECIANT